ncbi:Hypothetical predicted protein, partial [Mytilus galloprovincialis]
PLNMLLKKANAFMEKYSLLRLTFGSIVNLLDKINLKDNDEKIGRLIRTIKGLIDKRPCFHPKQATDEQLRTELTERGKSSAGTREQMITRLLQLENKMSVRVEEQKLLSIQRPICREVKQKISEVFELSISEKLVKMADSSECEWN